MKKNAQEAEEGVTELVEEDAESEEDALEAQEDEGLKKMSLGLLEGSCFPGNPMEKFLFSEHSEAID